MPVDDGHTFCASLAEVRSNIDRLDRDIIRLMAERGGFVCEAARFKTDTAAVAAPARVEQVIAKVRGLAEEAGLPPEVAEAAYRAMIGAFITMERAEFEKTRNG